MKLCLVAGCGALAERWPRCPAHQRAWERERRERSPERRAYRDQSYKAYRAMVQRRRPNCWLCGEIGADSVDHVIPISRGGTNDWSNLRPAHLSCNIRKHNHERSSHD